ncbi:MAG: hypothetical protein ABIF40_04905 [archaeon]
MAWFESLNPILKTHLSEQFKQSHKQRKAFSKAKDPSKAQLWCAIAFLSKQVSDLDYKVKYLERVSKIKSKDIKNLKKY